MTQPATHSGSLFSADPPGDAFDLTEAEVGRRFDSARRSGRPAWLWPGIDVGEWRQALREIERVTREVLRGSDAPHLTAPNAEALGIAGYTSGMGPLLGFWIQTGAISAAPEAASILGLHLYHNRLRMGRLESETQRVLELLRRARVVPVVLKGFHTAHAYFPDPATRPVSDIDLLIGPGEVDMVARVLREAGYQPKLIQHRPYKCDWVPAGSRAVPRSLSLVHAEDPFALDVHVSLDRNFFGVATVRLDSVVQRRRMEVAGGSGGIEVEAHVLAQPALALLLATHASEGLHNLTLIRLVELALVLQADAAADALAWKKLVQAATTAGGLRYAYPALRLTERLIPGTIPADVLGVFRAATTPAMRRVLDPLRPADVQRLDRLSLEERLMWAGSAREHMRRLIFALWPAPAGRSPIELARIYSRRGWRLIRGAVDP